MVNLVSQPQYPESKTDQNSDSPPVTQQVDLTSNQPDIQKPPQKTKKWIIPGIIVLLVLVLSAASFLAYRYYVSDKQAANRTASDLIPTEAPPSITPSDSVNHNPSPEDSNLGNYLTYSSDKLGVSFNYAPEYAGEKAVVREEGNKIYVGSAHYSTQFIEIFTVEPGLSVVEDINQKFLSSYSETDCVVTDPVQPNDPKNVTGAYPIGDNYRVVSIEANVPYDDPDVLMEALKKCPYGYTRSNGVGYFAYNTEYPEKYIFYSIGQEPAWPSDTNAYGKGKSNISWMQTLKFTSK